ncbi:MAG: dihydrodipicolinate synthase family protein, partial [Candidatus Bipolaricaulota bacterium]
CGRTEQAVYEAQIASELGYDVALVSLAAFGDQPEVRLVEHCRQVGEVLPLMGFYLQPAVGGRHLSPGFWRSFCELEASVAIKVAPFDRYRTLDVLRALAESGAEGRILLYTGNDDHIVLDLLSPHSFSVGGRLVQVGFVGGLLGQWAVWTRQAVELMEKVRALRERASPPSADLLAHAGQLTEANGAIFDARNGFAGCIPGIHEVLRRSGLLAGRWCLDPDLELSPGQFDEISRVCQAYPYLTDEVFVKENLDDWLR